jgi:hypothetical protein
MSKKMPSQAGPGPRAMLKSQQYRQIAEQKTTQLREQIRELQNDSPQEPLESNCQRAYADTKLRLVRSSPLDVRSQDDLKKMPGQSSPHTVTIWSHELKRNEKPHFPVTPHRRGSPLFAKSTSFTNEIRDPRVSHSECHEPVNH